MALSRRYMPSWPPGERGYIGMDFSDVIPPGQALITGTMTIVTNTNPTEPQTDFEQTEVTLEGRQAWCLLEGGAVGTDYQVRWVVGDSVDHAWHRTALLLCAESS